MGETMWMVRAKMDIQCSPKIVKGFTVFNVYTVGNMPNMNALIKVLESRGIKVGEVLVTIAVGNGLNRNNFPNKS